MVPFVLVLMLVAPVNLPVSMRGQEDGTVEAVPLFAVLVVPLVVLVVPLVVLVVPLVVLVVMREQSPDEMVGHRK